MRDDHPELSKLKMGSVNFRIRLRRTWTVPAESGTAMSLTLESRGGCPAMG
jgi:hypothetical protein